MLKVTIEINGDEVNCETEAKDSNANEHVALEHTLSNLRRTILNTLLKNELGITYEETVTKSGLYLNKEEALKAGAVE